MPTNAQAEPVESPTRPFTLAFPVTLEAVVEPEAEGGFSASVPSLPGCFTEAETLDELQANLIEAAEGWLTARRDMAAAAHPLTTRDRGFPTHP
jgi:predicted RNase H-like HicB family nuclease